MDSKSNIFNCIKWLLILRVAWGNFRIEFFEGQKKLTLDTDRLQVCYEKRTDPIAAPAVRTNVAASDVESTKWT